MPDPHRDADLWVALSLVNGLGSAGYRTLLKAFGSPQGVFGASYASLSAIVAPSVAEQIARGPQAAALEAFQAWIQAPDSHLVTLADPDYPARLLQIPDPPPLLYLKGQRQALSRPALAVVGSRNATVQGVRNAEAFSRSLSEGGLCVVSGLALGVDGAAHRGALAGPGGTLAVVGTGLDIVYPARHRNLAHEICASGALVSEFALGTPSLAANFPRRNRIISGLSLGCLVVEAALRSGSLITARLSAEQGREVFAIPGSIHSPLSKGCHALLKQGAKLVESAQDIFDELNLPGPEPVNSDDPAGDPEDALLAHLGFDPVDVDTLAQRSGMPAAELAARLLTLELDGLVATLPGGLYQRVV